MKTYTCSYKFDDKRYVVHVVAENHEEAVRRLRSVGTTGKVDGELVAEILVTPPSKTSILEIVMWMLLGALMILLIKQWY